MQALEWAGEIIGGTIVLTANPIAWIVAAFLVWRRTPGDQIGFTVVFTQLGSIWFISLMVGKEPRSLEWLGAIASGILIAIVVHLARQCLRAIRKRKGPTIKNISNIEDSHFERVAAEMDSGEIDSGLWAKALALAEGDPQVQRAQYIKLRVVKKAMEAQQAEKNILLSYRGKE